MDKLENFLCTRKQDSISFNVRFLENMDKDNVTLHYLVGRNGSGKTLLLEAIYASLTNSGGSYLKIQTAGGASYHSFFQNQTQRTPILYSTPEITFGDESIGSVTAQTADNKDVLEKSSKLDRMIPQLLVDIWSQDAVASHEWVKKNQGKETVIDMKAISGIKLDRFTKAYNSIFDNKKFKEIKKENGQYVIYFERNDGKTIRIESLSTGEKQILFRVGFILKNLDSMNRGIILIDEPELSLHPSWQTKLKNLLIEVFKDTKVQIVIATHSPYIFRDMNPDIEECISIDVFGQSSYKVEMIISGVRNSPSMNYVNYKAYEEQTNELHIELFAHYYAKFETETGTSTPTPTLREFNDWVHASTSENKANRSKTSASRFEGRYTCDEVLPLWIRNYIHHPDITDRIEPTSEDIKASIDFMINELR